MLDCKQEVIQSPSRTKVPSKVSSLAFSCQLSYRLPHTVGVKIRRRVRGPITSPPKLMLRKRKSLALHTHSAIGICLRDVFLPHPPSFSSSSPSPSPSASLPLASPPLLLPHPLPLLPHLGPYSCIIGSRPNSPRMVYFLAVDPVSPEWP